jgi:hypothetical protein
MDGPAAGLSYRKLSSAKSEIRLLELQPTADIEHPPVCSLVNVKHTESLEFLAVCCLLSDKETEIITIDNKQRRVPATLGQALRHVRTVFFCATALTPTRSHSKDSKDSNNKLVQALRHMRSFLNESKGKGDDDSRSKGQKSNTLYVWVETLCVNHEDEQEMDQQYAYMAMAFRSAQVVLGWLGPKDELTDIALDTLQQVAEAIPPRWGDPEDKKVHPENYAPQHVWLEKLAHLWADRREGPYFHALMEFTERPFFSRTWLIEEMSMATHPAFLIGDRLVSWIHFIAFVRVLEELKDNKSVVFPGDLTPVAANWPLSTVYTIVSEMFPRHPKPGW